MTRGAKAIWSRRRAGARRGDEGSVAVEAAVLGPVLVLFILVIAAFGRVAVAHQAVDAAAAQAARAASIARTPAEASGSAQDAAAATLDDEHLECLAVDVDVDVTGFAAPVGQPASVGAAVTCVVNLADLVGVPGLPGTIVVSGEVRSPLDTYRERG